jgi:type VI secretion system secreted protein VgrG
VLRTGGNNFLVMDDIDGQQFIEMSTPVDTTAYTMGGPKKLDLTIPPWDPAYHDTKPFRFGYHLKTEGDAGFVVGGSWYQWVGADHFLDVVGESRTRCGKRRTLIVGGPSNELYLSTRTTKIASGRKDTVQAGGMEQEINGGFSLKIAPDGKQEVSGNWLHNVGGTWKNHVGGAYSISAAGNVSIDSTAGTVSLSSPSSILLKAPEIEQITGDWLQVTGKSFLLYTSANTAGIHKFDAAGIANTVTGLSTSQIGVSIGVAAVKVEANGLEHVKQGAKIGATGMAVANGAIRVLSFGMLKL